MLINDLLNAYLTCVKTVRLAIRCGNATLCDMADRHRGQIHDQILTIAGKKRGDIVFGAKLAQWVDDMIDAEQEITKELRAG